MAIAIRISTRGEPPRTALSSVQRTLPYLSIMCMIRLTAGGWDNSDNPCAVGGTPSMAPVLRPSMCSPPPLPCGLLESGGKIQLLDAGRGNLDQRLPLHHCGGRGAPVLYRSAQRELLPPRAHSSA